MERIVRDSSSRLSITVTSAAFVRLKLDTYQHPDMATNVRKLGIGVALLVASALVIIGTGTMQAPVPDPLAAVAAIGLAAGSLLVGLSEDNAGV
jgi:hypothetical protein